MNPLRFGDFQLDPKNETLRKEHTVIPLRPKAFALLAFLVANPQRLISKQELLEKVWPDAYVGDAVLKVSIRELRRALEDTAQEPRYIETVHRRGYRFLQEVETVPSTVEITATLSPEMAYLVGRAQNLQNLQVQLQKCLEGQRQFQLIAGAAGMGKTTLVTAFTESIRPNDGIHMGWGQCSEQFGEGEPYLPLLEAIGSLSREIQDAEWQAQLRQIAPTWFTQFPWLIQDQDRELLEREILGTTRERMLRELAEFLETWSSQKPLLIVLEDLHWADVSTVDFLNYMGRRRAACKLFLLGTYRPVELILRDHPFKEIKQELVVQKRYQETALEHLDPTDIHEYLQKRWPASSLPSDFALWLHKRTDGNPLFLINLLEFLVERGALIETPEGCRLEALEPHSQEMPESLRQILEKQLERCTPEELRILEAASLAGLEFSAAAVAAGLDLPAPEMEAQCEQLARKNLFIRGVETATFPNGTISSRFRFVHSLYQNLLRNRLTPSQTQTIQLRLGWNGERVYGESAAQIAVELTNHFEQGREWQKALQYAQLAAENCLARWANHEADRYLRKAQDHLQALGTKASLLQKLGLLEQRGKVLRSLGAMQEATECFAEIADYARLQENHDWHLKGLLLQASALSWIDRNACLNLVDQVDKVARTLEPGLLQADALASLSYWNLLWRGWEHCDPAAMPKAMKLAEAQGAASAISHHQSRYSLFLSLQGRYAQAAESARQGLQLAISNKDNFDALMCQYYEAWALLHRGRWRDCHAVLVEAVQKAQRNENKLWLALFQFQLAWLHEHARDAHEASRLAASGLELTEQLDHSFGLLLGNILYGRALLGTGDLEQAKQRFDTAASRSQAVLMEGICEILLHEGRARLAWHHKDHKALRHQAQLLHDAAFPSQEPSYLAASQMFVAEAYLLERQWVKAQRAMEAGQEIAAVGICPTFAWQLHDVAARIAEGRKQKAAGVKARRDRQQVMDGIADEIPTEAMRAAWQEFGPSSMPLASS